MFRKIYVVLGVTLALFMVGSVAYADTASDQAALFAVTTPLGLLLVAVVSFVIPFLVDLITKKFAASGIKSFVLLALSLINGLIMEWINSINNNVAWDWQQAVTTALLTLIISGSAFFTVLKPAKLAGADGVLATAGGIGKVDEMKVAKAVEYGNLPSSAAPAAAQGDAP